MSKLAESCRTFAISTRQLTFSNSSNFREYPSSENLTANFGFAAAYQFYQDLHCHSWNFIRARGGLYLENTSVKAKLDISLD